MKSSLKGFQYSLPKVNLTIRIIIDMDYSIIIIIIDMDYSKVQNLFWLSPQPSHV